MPCVPTMLNINVDRQLNQENKYFDNKKQKLFET